MNRPRRIIGATSAVTLIAVTVTALSLSFARSDGKTEAPATRPAGAADFTAVVTPFLQAHCNSCHSAEKKKGSLDLQRFTSVEQVRKEPKVWQHVIEQMEAGEMPPKDKPQPTAAENARVLAWVRGFLDGEARANAGDPGFVPLRRLSNVEYDHTIRDLARVDLRPAKDFPADGAAGEGFTNAAEALTDVSPALFNKYLNAAKEVSAHAVLLPDGFRFSVGKTRRDWTDESTANLRAFYAKHAPPDGKLVVKPYLAATVTHRDALSAGSVSIVDVAAREKLNAKYLGALWSALNEAAPGAPMDIIVRRWKAATPDDFGGTLEEIAKQQAKSWKTAKIGSYVRPTGDTYAESLSRQRPANPTPPPADVAGYDRFRAVFPLFLCFPPVVPTDEVVSLKMFHREDEPLLRLFLGGMESAELEHLWAEHRFISRQAIAENEYLPQFIGFVTQDQPKSMVAYFEGRRPAFKQRADEALAAEIAAEPKQLAALADFAARAYRRPISEKEEADLLGVYQSIRQTGAGHDEAFRGALTRILIAPAFLFRVETAPPGDKPGNVAAWELATRLSYFLWSSAPDEELRRLAAAGTLADPAVTNAQVRRMIADEKSRALAIEFGTQWLHVRGFDTFNEKSETVFPAFDASLRGAMYEEAIRFFQDLFQADRPITDLLDADHTFLNEPLAKHYGVPNVSGPQWRRVDGVKKHGRGGVLGLGSVQAKQAGASRTSPVLRGNWVVETLLGEKLPRPPPDVPQLPQAEGDGGLSVRQQVERHAKDAACATCHVRIDPFGFALEEFDAIGRRRDKDLSGLPIDATARLRDGTEFRGIDGLRQYLLTKKQDVVVRLFCRRLLGYAIGRSVTLSDGPLIDEMVQALGRDGGKVQSAIRVIVASPQFRMIRGADHPE